jgi:hypothetical protein
VSAQGGADVMDSYFQHSPTCFEGIIKCKSQHDFYFLISFHNTQCVFDGYLSGIMDFKKETTQGI